MFILHRKKKLPVKFLGIFFMSTQICMYKTVFAPTLVRYLSDSDCSNSFYKFELAKLEEITLFEVIVHALGRGRGRAFAFYKMFE